MKSFFLKFKKIQSDFHSENVERDWDPLPQEDLFKEKCPIWEGTSSDGEKGETGLQGPALESWSMNASEAELSLLDFFFNLEKALQNL